MSCVATIKEGILFLAVAVDVAINQNLLVLNIHDLVHKCLCIVHFWVQIFARQDPLAIQIHTS